MDNDVEAVDRSVFNLFVLLSDVGGLYGLFISGVSTILAIRNFQKSYNFLVDHLYLRQMPTNKEDENNDGDVVVK